MLEPIITSLYETDFYAWTQEQIPLLRLGKFNQIDLQNIAEEIECLGKQQRQELRNRLAVLLGHLLKYHFQATHRSKSWLATIREQRRRLTILLDDSPSLRPYIKDAIAVAYPLGTDIVVQETPLDYIDLPETCPYTVEQILNHEFLPN